MYRNLKENAELRKNVVGLSIRRLRLARGLSQEQLAVQMQLRGLPLTKLTISRIETGRRMVWDYEVKAFAQFFCVPFDCLYP